MFVKDFEMWTVTVADENGNADTHTLRIDEESARKVLRYDFEFDMGLYEAVDTAVFQYDKKRCLKNADELQAVLKRILATMTKKI